MKIRIPKTIAIVANLATGEPAKEPYTFARHFLCNGLLLDSSWAKSMARLYMAMTLRGLFLDANEDEAIAVTVEQQKALAACLEDREAPIAMALAVQIKPYFDAVMCPEKDD